ncbi:SDR family oxidoreductase [Burkholderia anthina]|uniref:SDR family oxidoreductase n=1 Tax=Burkholderia anthina TaxID=179879 RepID=UPI001AA0A5CA|nr:SDR family oxidoreductase [Burkholderia anthina]QTD94938.1 SDR family oxidoreductase [Burkholderia anthina]
MNRLKGKTAVVTAAAQGIGRATAELFASEGARVIAIDSNPHALADLQGDHDKLETHVLDVLDMRAIEDLIGKVGTVDVLFNGVGVVHVGNIMDCSEAQFDAAMTINVKSAYGLIRAVLPGMIAKGNGSIINMSSVQSSVKGFPQRFAYATSKAAIIGMTKSVAADYARQGVRCNVLCPSAVDTPSMRARIDAMANPVQAAADFAARQPIGRMGTPEDIALLATYLASDESGFVTGSVMLIDGGAAM